MLLVLWPWFVALTSLFGLLIGSFLNVVVWRVPRNESLLTPSRCPHCAAPIKPWQNVPVLSWLALLGRCASCRSQISARYPLVELGTALVFGLIAWWHIFFAPLPADAIDSVSWWLTLAAYLWFAAASIALTLIDLELKRLPDAIVLPSLAVVAALFLLAALLDSDWHRFIGVSGGALALFGLYVLIALIYPRGIGGGDVKLAPLTGAAMGYVGWDALVVGAFAAFLIGAVVGLALMAARKATRKSNLPFGPFMLIGAWLGIVFGKQLLAAYLGLFDL